MELIRWILIRRTRDILLIQTEFQMIFILVLLHKKAPYLFSTPDKCILTNQFTICTCSLCTPSYCYFCLSRHKNKFLIRPSDLMECLLNSANLIKTIFILRMGKLFTRYDMTYFTTKNCKVEAFDLSLRILLHFAWFTKCMP